MMFVCVLLVPSLPGVALRGRARALTATVRSRTSDRSLQAAGRGLMVSALFLTPPPRYMYFCSKAKVERSSTAWNWCRRTRERSPVSRSPACGAPRTSSSPTATDPAALLRRCQEAVTAKPTVSELGIDPPRKPGIAPAAATAPSRSPSRARDGADWVLMRVAGDPEQRIPCSTGTSGSASSTGRGTANSTTRPLTPEPRYSGQLVPGQLDLRITTWVPYKPQQGSCQGGKPL